MADSRWKKCSLSWAQGHPGKCPLLDWPAESNCSFEAGPGVIDNLRSPAIGGGRHVRHRHAKFFCSLDGKLVVVRATLGERLQPDGVDGHMVSGVLTREAYLALAPLMLELNDLIGIIRTDGKQYAEESLTALDLLNALLREKLGLKYTITSKTREESATSG